MKYITVILMNALALATPNYSFASDNKALFDYCMIVAGNDIKGYMLVDGNTEDTLLYVTSRFDTLSSASRDAAKALKILSNAGICPKTN